MKPCRFRGLPSCLLNINFIHNLWHCHGDQTSILLVPWWPHAAISWFYSFHPINISVNADVLLFPFPFPLDHPLENCQQFSLSAAPITKAASYNGSKGTNKQFIFPYRYLNRSFKRACFYFCSNCFDCFYPILRNFVQWVWMNIFVINYFSAILWERTWGCEIRWFAVWHLGK